MSSLGFSESLLNEEEGGHTISHIGSVQRPAKVKKTATCLKHLGVFLDTYGAPGKQFETLLNNNTDPYNLPYEIINSEEFVGCYVNFLATEAKYLDSSGKLLAFSTAAGYASTFCTYYLHHFREHPNGPPLPLRSESWPRKMALLTERKQDYHHKTGTKMKSEKETATDDDRRNLAKICILEGSQIGAEMFHISNSAVTLAGRGSDVADADISHVRSHKQTEDLLEYHILIQDTTRFKTSTKSDHRIFPHRDSLFFCYYFSFAYILLLHDSMTNKLFPSFSERVFDAEKRVDSKVATFFNKCIDHFWQLMYDYAKGECN